MILQQYRNAMSLVIDGVERERRDDTARLFRAFSVQGVETSTLAYDAQENADADARALAVTQDANQRSIEDKLDAAMADVQALLDATNATINAGPAPYIKTLGRVARLLIRLARRKFDGTS